MYIPVGQTFVVPDRTYAFVRSGTKHLARKFGAGFKVKTTGKNVSVTRTA